MSPPDIAADLERVLLPNLPAGAQSFISLWDAGSSTLSCLHFIHNSEAAARRRAALGYSHCRGAGTLTGTTKGCLPIEGVHLIESSSPRFT